MDADRGIDDEIDAAYRSKYHRYGDATIRRITSPDARATTIKLAPRAMGSQSRRDDARPGERHADHQELR